VPVKLSYIEKYKNVFNTNERVICLCEWQDGFMCLGFVGAFNVGSIEMGFDEEIKTNTKLPYPAKFSNIHEYKIKPRKLPESLEKELNI